MAIAGLARPESATEAPRLHCYSTNQTTCARDSVCVGVSHCVARCRAGPGRCRIVIYFKLEKCDNGRPTPVTPSVYIGMRFKN